MKVSYLITGIHWFTVVFYYALACTFFLPHLCITFVFIHVAYLMIIKFIQCAISYLMMMNCPSVKECFFWLLAKNSCLIRLHIVFLLAFDSIFSNLHFCFLGENQQLLHPKCYNSLANKVLKENKKVGIIYLTDIMSAPNHEPLCLLLTMVIPP